MPLGYLGTLGSGVTDLITRTDLTTAAGQRMRFLGPWAANTAYAVNDVTTNAGGLYVRKTAGTSGATFDAANWTALVAPPFVAAASFTINGGNNAQGTAFTGGAAFNTVPFNTVAYDTSSGFNSSDYTWTIPTTGIYAITANVRPVDNASSGVNVGMGVGTINADSPTFTWSITQTRSNTIRQNFNYSRSGKFTAGDKVRLFTYCDGASLNFTSAALSLTLMAVTSS